jgi:hypothetical protein
VLVFDSLFCPGHNFGVMLFGRLNRSYERLPVSLSKPTRYGGFRHLVNKAVEDYM